MITKLLVLDCCYCGPHYKINNTASYTQQSRSPHIQSTRLALDVCLFHHGIPVELRIIVQLFLQANLSNGNIRQAVKMWTSYQQQNHQHQKQNDFQSQECRKQALLLYGYISYWDTHLVTNMSYLFQHKYDFNDPIEYWDVSNVVDMSYMFQSAKQFNQSLKLWQVGHVTSMCGMFSGAQAFNQCIDAWDVQNVVNMGYMFHGASSFNSPLHSWQTKSVKNMSYMFACAFAFNQSLATWDVSNVLYMKAIFKEAKAFDNNKTLSSWNISDETLTDMIKMQNPLICWFLSLFPAAAK